MLHHYYTVAVRAGLVSKLQEILPTASRETQSQEKAAKNVIAALAASRGGLPKCIVRDMKKVGG